MQSGECHRIAVLLRAVLQGDPWYGSATSVLLDGIGAEQAASRPYSGAASIWEVLLHMTAWNGEVRRRLEGGVPGLPQEGDWPAAPAAASAAWEEARSTLFKTTEQLARAIEGFSDDRLEDLVGGPDRSPAMGTGVSFYSMLHGVVQHMVYHTAQIAALKKALAARNAG